MANTPYDDVFRTLVNDCRSLLIPYVNEMFGENYTGDEEIRFNPNEQFIVQQDGEEENNQRVHEMYAYGFVRKGH